MSSTEPFSAAARTAPPPAAGPLPAGVVFLDRLAIAAGGLRAALRRAAWRLRSGAEGSARTQARLRWPADLPRLEGAVAPRLRALGLQAEEGRGALYLPPQPALARIAPQPAAFYPPGAGFRVLKRPGRDGPLRESLRSKFGGRPQDRVFVANYLHCAGLGPRLFDLCSWILPGGEEASVFVVEHIEGRTPLPEDVRRFRQRLARELSRKHLRILRFGWRWRREFRPPDCNANLLAPAGGGDPLYVDFDAFALDCPPAWTAEVLERASSRLRIDPLRGAFAPTVEIPGGRGCPANLRWSRALATLASSGIRLEGRIVIELATRAALALHSALVEGAAWGIGEVEPDACQPARDLLHSLGSTRFSLVERGRDPWAGLPPSLAARLPESVVFCREEDRPRTENRPWRALVVLGGDWPREPLVRVRS